MANLFENNEKDETVKPFICNHCQLGWHGRCQAPGECECQEEVDKVTGFTTTELHISAMRAKNLRALGDTDGAVRRRMRQADPE